MPLLCLLLGLLGAGRDARALDPGRTLEQFHHTAWTQRDGAPTAIYTMAQTADGFLWLGAASGLFRFDGVRFEAYEFANGQRLPSLAVGSLAVDQQRQLWIGTQFGGVSVLSPDGALHHYRDLDGLRSTVNLIVVDRAGAVWVSTSTGLARFDHGRWHALPEFAGKIVRGMALDRAGTLWVTSENTLSSVAPGSHAVRHRAGGALTSVMTVGVGPDDKVWISTAQGLAQVGDLDGAGVIAAGWFGHRQWGFLFDRDGSLWLNAAGPGRPTGVGRIPHPRGLDAGPAAGPPQAIQTLGAAQGLSGADTGFFFEDREGNVWVSTTGGLDRFRDNRLTLETAAPRSEPMVWAGRDGKVWFAATNSPLMHGGAGARAYPEYGNEVTAIQEIAAGQFWFATAAGLWRYDGDSDAATAIAVPAALSDRRVIQTMLYDRDGDLWISVPRSGLFRRHAGAWQADPLAGLLTGPFPGAPISSHLDPAGRLWFGYADSQVAVLERGRARRLDAGAGLDVGNVFAFCAMGAQMLVGGDLGLNRYDGRRFHPILGVNGERFLGVTGMLFTADGALWLNHAAGVSRIPAGQLAAPGTLVEYDRFDHQDGLPGLRGRLRPLPTLSLAPDGRLWFATSNGVSSIDPLHIQRNPLPPPVVIRNIRSNDQWFAASGAPRLPEHTVDLEIAYTALSLAIPERLRFRYRLDGVDAGWRDVGNRRTAYYNNLAPGDYHFHVIASNNDGVWNERGASLAFSIAPAFHQTWWFKLGCLLLAGLALWLLHRLRLRVISARHRARLDERERIARELHDTLLQSTQGLIVQFQAIADQLPATAAARGRMSAALDQADCVLAEGRDRVLELRTAAAPAAELAGALRATAAALARQYAVAWQLAVEGEARALQPAAESEVLRIAGEALSNAFRHAGASRIELRLVYAAAALGVTVADDGIGMPAAVLQSGGRDGHWGLAGMRERAAQLGATLQLDSGAAGTVVTLRLPAAGAYRGRRATLRRWRAWWRARGARG